MNVDDIWIDSSSGIEYVYIRSNNATQWVEFGATGTPLNGTAGLGFSDQTMYGVDAGTDVTIQQIGTGSINLSASNVNTTANLNAPFVTVRNSTFTSSESAVRIIGSSTGSESLPVNSGYMLSITGRDNLPSRVINSAYGTNSYALYAGRAARGNIANPEAIQSGDVVSRIAASPHDGTSFPSFGTGRIDVVATENHTVSNKGTRIEFWTMQTGSNTYVNIATFNGANVSFTGYVNAQKGFISTPRTVTNSATLVINFETDGVIRLINNIGATISFTNYFPGKQVDVWVTNTDNNSKSFTHGCTSTNSTNNNTTKSIPGTSSMLLRYICFGTDSANVQVAIVQG